jgi:hypothetical protein
VKTAHVFDYDDTLSHSDYRIHVYPYHDGKPTEIHRVPGLAGIPHEGLEHLPAGLRYSFSTREFVKVSRAIDTHGVRVVPSEEGTPAGHSVVFDFGDVVFLDEDESSPIGKNTIRLERAAAAGCDIWVVTGRSPGGEAGIQKFIETHTRVRVPLSRIVCVGGSGPTAPAKSQAFLTKVIPSGPYDEIYFYDDDERNLERVKEDVSPFARLYLVNSVTDEVQSDAKDRVTRARQRRKDGDDFRRIRQLTGTRR